MTIRIRSYTYVRNGKTIHVKEHTRKGSPSSKGSGSEYLKRARFVEFSDWESFREDVNDVGWENMALDIDSDWPFEKKGNKTVLKMSDPTHGDGRFFGLKINNKLVGATRVFDENGVVYIGNFEVFPKYKGMGLGKKLFRGVQSRYPNRDLTLNYGSEGARKFWEKMGFSKTYENATIMEKKIKK